MPYYLGVDIGGTKTHAVIADEKGTVAGFGHAGPGNHESVGYDGLHNAVREAISGALEKSDGLAYEDISGGGFGVAGYDWPDEKPLTEKEIDKLGVAFPYIVVNDTIPGLVAGSRDGWGVVVVSGTGCNCRGWDQDHQREAYMTGSGYLVGENAGATELIVRAMQLVTFEWSCRGPATALTQAFIEYVGAEDSEDLIEGYCQGRYSGKLAAPAARLVFEVAEAGDTVAIDLIAWAGRELGDMACGIIRKLSFEKLAFDVVLSGSLFDGGAMLIEPMRETIQQVALQARLVKLEVPPVIGAVLIGMEQGGLKPTDAIRAELNQTISLAT
ncbi:N-acetylglucosamine kinase [Chloroflexota bacterium]